MRASRLKDILPSWTNALLAVLAAALLILAFPDFEFWFLAWFALVPLMWAVEREVERGHSCPHEPEGRTDRNRLSTLLGTLSLSCGPDSLRSFFLGWIFGTLFFFGTCWWLTFAPITYAGFPPLLAYFLLFCVTLVAGLFPALFAAMLSLMLRRFGSWGFLAGPFIWTATEFARYWITGNNWNALGYSQAFGVLLWIASLGGVLLCSFALACVSSAISAILVRITCAEVGLKVWAFQSTLPLYAAGIVAVPLILLLGYIFGIILRESPIGGNEAQIVAIQPNVPMSGLNPQKWDQLRQRQIELAEAELQNLRATNNELPTTVILPESPMNFMYNDDLEFQRFIGDFARRNNVSVLFNSAEPDASNGKYFNSAVLVGPDGKKAEQYDKIYLLPFGEAVPLPLQNIVPAFVGTFSYGSEYDLVPLGDAKAGIMICFESHFGELSREYVRNGADAIIEMTNDGYLGPTPVLRQHLANAVFRAVETNRPVLRVTNVGITAYIDERGSVHDPLPSYQEGTRVWSVSKSDGSQTFYVKYGDWFAWLCVAITLGLILFSLRRQDRSGIGDR